MIDPLDYEAVISELEAEFREDPLQDLLLFPDLDFTVSTLFSICVCVFASEMCTYLWCLFSFTSHYVFWTFLKSVCSEKALFFKSYFTKRHEEGVK